MRYVAVCILTFLTVCQVEAAPSIRVVWNTTGHDFVAPPVFHTEGVKAAGTVIADLALHPDGKVDSVKIVSGDPALRVIVMESAKTWRFASKPPLPGTLRTWFYFVVDDGTKSGPAPAPPPPPFGTAIGLIDISGLAASSQKVFVRSLGFKVGDVFDSALMKKASGLARNFTPPMTLRVTLTSDSKVRLMFALRDK